MPTLTQRFLTDEQRNDLRLLIAARILDIHQPKPKTPKSPEPQPSAGRVLTMKARTA